MKFAWNEDWLFTKNFEKGFIDAETVRIPHNVKEMSENYCDENAYQMVCGYKKEFEWNEELSEKRVFVTFDGAAHQADIFLNDEKIYSHFCGYTAFTVELTKKLLKGKNILTVRLDTRETIKQPPFGYVIDYMTFGGIYREVWFEVKENIFIEDAFVMAGNKTNKNEVTIDITLNGAEKSDKCVVLSKIYEFNNVGNDCISKMEQMTSQNIISNATVVNDTKKHEIFIDDNGKTTLKLLVESPKYWSLGDPQMYYLELILENEKIQNESFVVKFGFRDMQFKKDGFYLQGEKIKIRGLNRHQSFPYVGYAMPKSMQWEDARILKEELSVNAVRTSHYPQSQHFLDACDSLGLLVFTEIPGWQHVGDEQWQDIAINNCEEMVTQYRNHPSIMLWGVRINESTDFDDFYTKTNKTAHELDSTRQTSGVRYLEKSHLLEDVYAYNDFSYSGGEKSPLRPVEKVTPDTSKPYFISECNGHMFPTKMWDTEEHRLEHALRHAKVLEKMYQTQDISGLFGWCMFDYNTHKDFGSGDRVCYHGVMDMFRNPKMAAAVYSSQSDDKQELEISSTMDIGEHPAGDIGDVYAFTNADSIKLYKNDIFVREFKAPESAMPHKPICIDDFIGELLQTQEGYEKALADKVKECLNAIKKYGQESLPFKYKLKMAQLMLFYSFTFEKGVELFGKYVGNWGGNATVYRIEAIKDGKVVKTVYKEPSTNVKLKIKLSKDSLTEETTYDVIAVRITAVDEHDNKLPYYQEPVELEVEGDIELIGSNVISLKGGASGTYIRSKCIKNGLKEKNGLGILKIKGKELEEIYVKIPVYAAD